MYVSWIEYRTPLISLWCLLQSACTTVIIAKPPPQSGKSNNTTPLSPHVPALVTCNTFT